MFTSTLFLALAHSMAIPAPESNPHWLDDYWVAQKKGQLERKPMAVFVGSGQLGYNQLIREGKLSEATKKILAQKYVCVYLDSTQKNAQKLIREMAVSQGRALVISDRTGQVQAFHYEGVLSEKDLVRNLERFANPDLVVQVTETNVQSRPIYTSAPVMTRGC